MRGSGYGLAVWQAAMQSLQGRTIGLDGVAAQQDNDHRSGFELAHSNARFAGTKAADAMAHRDQRFRVLPLTSFSTAQVVADDNTCFPEPREGFLSTWIRQPGTVALGVGTPKVVQGYGVLRPCREGFKIGPLFADWPPLAQALFCALVNHVPAGQPYFLDIMTTQDEAVALVHWHGKPKCSRRRACIFRQRPTIRPAAPTAPPVSKWDEGQG